MYRNCKVWQFYFKDNGDLYSGSFVVGAEKINKKYNSSNYQNRSLFRSAGFKQ